MTTRLVLSTNGTTTVACRSIDPELIAKAMIAKAMLSVRLARQGRSLDDFHLWVSRRKRRCTAYANYWSSDDTEYLSFELEALPMVVGQVLAESM
jgi:hypothetical protein